MAVASFGSIAAGVSAANAVLAKNRHSLVSTAGAVASAKFHALSGTDGRTYLYRADGFPLASAR